MKSLLAVFGFLAAVLGHTWHCENCLEYGSTSCQGSKNKCSEGSDKCIQGFENNTLNSDTRVTAFKTCHTPEMPSTACEASDHSFTCSQLHMRFFVECGHDMDPLKVPPMNLTHNGYKCPECFIEGSDKECETDKVIECTGRQTGCLTFFGQASRPQLPVTNYSFKGCSTPKACSLMPILPGTHVIPSKAVYWCTSATKV